MVVAGLDEFFSNACASINVKEKKTRLFRNAFIFGIKFRE